MTQVVRAERGRELCGLAQFGNNLPNAALRQRTALAEEEMSIRPATPGSNGFSPGGCSLAPLFRQMLAMGEIHIERFACFLDQGSLRFSPSKLL